MLGWQINIHRQIIGESPEKLTKASLLATWTTSIGGLDWLNAVISEGKVIFLGGNGYPLRYSISVENLLPEIVSGPPSYKGPLVIGDDYVQPSGWIGNAKIDLEKIALCLPDERLIIEAWDQS